jgi:DNA-binding LytR/AlgR family response regulator
LLKPFRHRELAIQIELAYNNYLEAQTSQSTTMDSDSFFLPVEKGKGYLKIAKKEVQYIRADSSYVEVYMEAQEEKQVFSMNLGYLEQFFPKPQFYRLGRSLLINLQFVRQINRGELWIEGRDKPIDYPESLYSDFLKKFKVIKTPGKKP